jgi:menaquinone-dependent protoporphyrinogen oxidase
MKVLVASGSKYGSTREVAQAIGQELTVLGFDVDVMDAHEVLSVVAYDAVVIGSAVYGGLWRRDAEELMRDHAPVLRHRDVWTFSVGIETIVSEGQPKDEAYLLGDTVNAHEHRRFTGALDPAKLNVGEKALIRALDPPLGDFRDFADIREWAQSVGATLAERAAL